MLLPVETRGLACIYRFYNPASGKSYIGMTADLKARFDNHYRNASESQRRSKFYTAIRKHGWDAFEFSILAVRPEGASNRWLVNGERVAIAMYDSFHNGYNMTPGGEESATKNPEVAAKISAALKGHIVTPETRYKMRQSNLGRKHTDAAKRKMSAAGTGRKQTTEHVAKRGLAVRGNSNGMFGRTSELNPMFGVARPDRAELNRLRVGEKNPRYGQKDTPETTAKRIAGQLARRERERAERLARLGTP